ncbi:MAG: type II toxin-antitoxin system Phd/YefM family antitoxin, partial [Desulfobacterales bacterium]|nr:type II toxin-antitoxin system Phd/YefM family antitoxin [Desulfobacterales bacterium]
AYVLLRLTCNWDTYPAPIQKAGHPLIITQNGKPAGVLLAPSDYDELVYKKAFVDSVNRGISDTESGNVYSTKELKAALNARRSM